MLAQRTLVCLALAGLLLPTASAPQVKPARSAPGPGVPAKPPAPNLQAEKASRLFSLALEHQRAGRDTQAISVYKQVVQLMPGAYPALMNLGLLYRVQNDAKSAEDAFKRAAAADPKAAMPATQLATLYLDLRRIPEAKEQAARAVALDPKSAQARFALAGTFAVSKDVAGAEREYRASVKLAPTNAQAHYNLGFVLGAQGKHKEAVASIQRAIQISPRMGVAYLSLGVVKQALKDLPGALAANLKAVELMPGNPAALFNVAILRQGISEKSGDQRMMQQAVSDYLRVIEVAPQYLAARANIARLYYKLRNYGQASVHFREAAKLDPKNLALLSDAAVAETWAAQGTQDPKARDAYRQSAERMFRQVLAQKPVRNAFVGLGYLYEQQGATDKAAGVYEEWSKKVPTDSAALISLGRSREAQKRAPEAIKLYERAITVAPKDPQGYLALGRANEGQQKSELAIQTYKRLTTAIPTSPEGFRSLGQLYQRANKSTEAITAYDALKRLAPKESYPYSAIAAICEKDGKLDEAVREFRALAGLEPGNAYARSSVARILERQKKYDEAITEYRALEKAQPTESSYVANIPRLLELAGKKEAADAEWKRLLDRTPADTTFRTSYASFLEKQSRHQEAILQFQAVLLTSPKLAWPWARIGAAQSQLKRTAEAKDAYSRAIEGGFDSPDVYDKLEAIHKEQNDDAGWLAMLFKQLKKHPNNVNGFTRADTVATRLKKTDEFAALLKEVAAQKDVDRRFLSNYASVLTRSGKPADALEINRRIAKDNPDDLPTRMSIAAQLESMDRLPELIAVYEEIMRIKTVTPASLVSYRYKLGSLYEKNGQKAEALGQYRELLKTEPNHKPAAEAVKRLGG